MDGLSDNDNSMFISLALYQSHQKITELFSNGAILCHSLVIDNITKYVDLVEWKPVFTDLDYKFDENDMKKNIKYLP